MRQNQVTQRASFKKFLNGNFIYHGLKFVLGENDQYITRMREGRRNRVRNFSSVGVARRFARRRAQFAEL